MMTEEDILKIFADTGALLTGHFELRSKLHSDRYFQCANVLRYPRIAAKLCDELVAKMKAACDIGPIDGVISPAVGGILVGHEIARALDTKCVFAEKVPGEGVDATGKPVTKLAMRRFALKPGLRRRRGRRHEGRPRAGDDRPRAGRRRGGRRRRAARGSFEGGRPLRRHPDVLARADPAHHLGARRVPALQGGRPSRPSGIVRP